MKRRFGYFDIYFRSARQLPMLHKEKVCWTQNRIEECWILNFRFGSYAADITQGVLVLDFKMWVVLCMWLHAVGG